MANNNRASLLANLRTGGVRSASANVPQTAAPTMSSFQHQNMPMSASLGGQFMDSNAQAQLLQMQMMQMEILRLQALQQVQQAQQYQLDLVRQQQQQQAFNRRHSQMVEPLTSGPTATSFIRSRASQSDAYNAQMQYSFKGMAEEQVPMTASLGGKFGARLNPNATSFRLSTNYEDDPFRSARAGNAVNNSQALSGLTSVISGGTALGSGQPSNSGLPPSKSDSSANWRKSNNSAFNGGNRSASVSVRVTPPPGERISPPPGVATTTKARPEPLRFSLIVNEPLPTIALDSSDSDVPEENDDTYSSSSAKSDSAPTTPPSGTGTGDSISPLTLREAASKRLYEGLGLGRPAPHSAQPNTLSFSGAETGTAAPFTSTGTTFASRVVSQPMRQPRGPPSGVDELGPKNFASRIRRKAIGGLEAMLDARVNRREVEAF